MIYYQDIDTTAGNSGSPIMITDTQLVNQMHKDGRKNSENTSPNRKSKKRKKSAKKDESQILFSRCIIGIHTGTDSSLGCNYGTLITNEMN